MTAFYPPSRGNIEHTELICVNNEFLREAAGSVDPMETIANSKNGIPIRLTDERWAHIVEAHGELTGNRDMLLETVSKPTRIFQGSLGELLAVREIEVGKWLVVVDREIKEDGFIITAFMTRRVSALERRQKLWP